ncbi:MAG: GH92 family glycosyl hydrolase [Prevotella sp.]|nr:GH92 family glycosyl hydrolase [Prevotella sp.]
MTYAADFASKVNTLIGTDYTGNTYPGAQVPFGMVQLSPDNGLPGWDRIAGYFYPDSTIAGFSHTHLLGTGAGDLYDISFLPVTLPYNEAEEPLGIHSRFTHKDETAHAGYYQVRLTDYDINVELTATPRCGVQRYTFPNDGKERMVILDLNKAMNWDATVDSKINVVDSFTIEGYRYSDGWARNQRVWFRTRFSQPIKSLEIESKKLQNNPNGVGCIARFKFTTEGFDKLVVTTALSPTSLEGAQKNLQAEAKTDDFDAVRRQAETLWNNELGRIEIEGASKSQETVFYTSLYHAMSAPTLLCDVDGTYLGADRKLHKADGWNNYETCSLWDTYRAAHPLYDILMPARAGEMVNSLIAFSKENGRLPIWNMWSSETDMMIGYHAASVIAEAILKGVPNINKEEALAECVKTANIDDYRGIGLYKKLGYVPYDVKEPTLCDDWSLSRTLEYAYDDACIAALAKSMNKTDVYKEFSKRAKNYRNVYCKGSTFMQPRHSDGIFQPAYSPDEYTAHICESNGWHYMWSVQHDIKGLEKLVGKKRFAEKLDSFFTYTPAANAELPLFSTGMIGQYAHGNEPSHHAAYIFNKIGQPHKTQKYVRQILSELYNDTPAGLCGNEDCGQTSAWYVFSALGFYPLNPVSCQYEVGSPLFRNATIHLENGNTFKIVTEGYSPEKYLVKEVLLNGKPLRGTDISHNDIMQGGTLTFVMQ